MADYEKMTAHPCSYCGADTGGNKYCNRSCQNLAWKRDNPEKYAAHREKHNAARRLARQTNPAIGRSKAELGIEPVVITTVPSYIERILACRNPLTHEYRCQSAPVRVEAEQMELI
jgi:hypothetical protein